MALWGIKKGALCFKVKTTEIVLLLRTPFQSGKAVSDLAAERGENKNHLTRSINATVPCTLHLSQSQLRSRPGECWGHDWEDELRVRGRPQILSWFSSPLFPL